jgi:hypothetical protein
VEISEIFREVRSTRRIFPTHPPFGFISILFDYGITDEQSLFRPFHPQHAERAKLHTLGFSKTEVAFNRPVPLGIENWPGRSKNLPAGLNTFLTADTDSFINHPGKGSPLPIHLKSSHRASLKAGRIGALMANLWLVISS